MSHSFTKTKSSYQKHPKVHFEQYIDNINEPTDDNSHDIPSELEAELLESSKKMRWNFRNRARKLRNRY
jgi:hypothetical protein